MPLNSKFSYVIEELPKHVDIKKHTGIRIMEIQSSKIAKILAPESSVNVDRVGQIVAEVTFLPPFLNMVFLRLITLFALKGIRS